MSALSARGRRNQEAEVAAQSRLSKLSQLSLLGKIFMYLILGILLLFVAITVIFPKAMGASTYTVLTGSMRPGLEPGHLIGVKPTPINELRIGDVITYQLESGKPTTVTHRIVGKSQSSGGETTFTTQGDANNVVDKLPVQEVQILGKLVYSMPYVGRITNLLTPQTKGVVTTVAGVGIIAYGVSLFLPKRPTRGRRAVTRAGAALIAGAFTFGPNIAPVQAAPAPTSPGIEVSKDGVHWDSAVAVELFPDAGLIIPGQTLRAPIWIRNTTEYTISASVTGDWVADVAQSNQVPTDPLSNHLELSYGHEKTPTWEITELAPQQMQETTVQVSFSDRAVGHQNSSADLNLVVSAQESNVSGPGEPIGGLELPQDENAIGDDGSAIGDLAQTGSTNSQAIAWIAILALLVGAIIRVRATRASRN